MVMLNLDLSFVQSEKYVENSTTKQTETNLQNWLSYMEKSDRFPWKTLPRTPYVQTVKITAHFPNMAVKLILILCTQPSIKSLFYMKNPSVIKEVLSRPGKGSSIASRY